MKHEIRVERSHADNKVFVAAHNMMVQISVLDDGIEVEITKGNDVLGLVKAAL